MKNLDIEKHYRVILFVLSIIYLIVVLGFAGISYRIVSSDTQEQLGSKAMILAIDIAERLQIDSSEQDRLLSLDFNQLLKDPANIDFEQKARMVMKYAHDIKYIYLEAPLTGEQVKYKVEAEESNIYQVPAGTPLNVVYLLDAVIDDQTRLEDTEGQGYTDKDRYTVMNDQYRQAYESRQPTSYLNADEWGIYITGFAPYYDNNGNYIGLIGVDLFLDTYLAYLEKNVLIIGGFAITLIFIGLFALYLTIRVRKVENLVLEKSLLSDTDGLTSLLNRRHFLEIMEDRWGQCKQDKKSIALLIIDVDHFKEYNDNYGHLAGDEVLRRIAKVLKDHVRDDYDYVGRYGGDEFFVMLNNTDIEMAQVVAECLLEKINGLKIEHKFSPVGDYGSVTIGLAAMVPEPDSELEELFQRADNALYFSKEQGKNQVQAWNDSIPNKTHHLFSDWA